MTKPMKTVTLPRDIYDELHALVKWQYDAPIEFGNRAIDALMQMEQNILERAGHVASTLAIVRFDEGMELVAEDEDGDEYLLVKGDD